MSLQDSLVLQYSWYFLRNMSFMASQDLIMDSPNTMNHLSAESLRVEGNSFSF
jgi:hypothetical protein